MFFRRVNDSYFGALGYSSKALSILASGTPFTDSESQGVVDVRFVEPGNYVLANPEISIRRGSVVYTHKPKRQTDIAFEVRSRECIYLGRFLLKPASDEFLWLDRRTQDVARVQQSLPPAFSINPNGPEIKAVGGIFVTQ